MSLFNRRAVLFAPFLLAACGFSPVYGTGGSGDGLQNQITISAPNTRNTFLLTRRLEERLGRTSSPIYRLTLEVETSTEGLAVNREGNINRFNLLGDAEYVLVEENTGRVVTSGSVDNFTSFSASGTTVSELAAARDAQERLMTLLADQIVVRLLSTDLS